VRAINRRLGKLEDRLGLVETEQTRQLAARFEAGRPCVSEVRAIEGYPERGRDLAAGADRIAGR